MAKTTLTNTGTAPFVVTDTEGKSVVIPPATAAAPPLPPPYPPADDQGRRFTAEQLEAADKEHPPNVVEVDLDDAMVTALKKRQEAGSPLHLGGHAGHGGDHRYAAGAGNAPKPGHEPEAEKPLHKR